MNRNNDDDGDMHPSLPTQASSFDDPGEVGAAVLHDDVQASASPVHDAVEVAHDEGMAKLPQDVHLDFTHETAIIGLCLCVKRVQQC